MQAPPSSLMHSSCSAHSWCWSPITLRCAHIKSDRRCTNHFIQTLKSNQICNRWSSKGGIVIFLFMTIESLVRKVSAWLPILVKYALTSILVTHTIQGFISFHLNELEHCRVSSLLWQLQTVPDSQINMFDQRNSQFLYFSPSRDSSLCDTYRIVPTLDVLAAILPPSSEVSLDGACRVQGRSSPARVWCSGNSFWTKSNMLNCEFAAYSSDH